MAGDGHRRATSKVLQPLNGRSAVLTTGRGCEAPPALKPSVSSDDDDSAGVTANGPAADEDSHDADLSQGVTERCRWLRKSMVSDDGGEEAAGSTHASPTQGPSQGLPGTAGRDAGWGQGGCKKDSVGGTEHASTPQECRDIDAFEYLGLISQGTYGEVFKAREKETGRLVAVKCFKPRDQGSDKGIDQLTLRETQLLRKFNHPNIVRLQEVVTSQSAPDKTYMVMEYCEHDLRTLIEDKSKLSKPFSTGQVKCLMQQLLGGVACLHAHHVLHRDLKAMNVLYHGHGGVKICDFGSARPYPCDEPLDTFTNPNLLCQTPGPRYYDRSAQPLTPGHQVTTLWYRAPEMLLGERKYSPAVDVWSVGCILADLLTGKPLLPGRDEHDQLSLIIQLLGTPSLEDWPGIKDLDGYKEGVFHKQVPPTLQQRFTGVGVGGTALTGAGFDLLQRLLAWDPAKRISAQQAMQHRWFKEAPLPVSSAEMPTFAPRKAG